VAAIHLRASRWYAEHDLRAEAVDHAVAASDHGRIVSLIERWGLETLLHNRVGLLQSWLAAVPDDVARARPAVPFFSGWCDIIIGQLGRGVARLHQAQQQLAGDVEVDPLIRLVIGGGAPMLEAHARVRSGELERAQQIAEPMIATLTPEAGSLLGAFLLARGLVALHEERLEDAMAAFVEAEPLLHGEHDNAVICVAYQARVYRARQRWDEAEAAARRALSLAEAADASHRSPAGYARVELAWVALSRGELAEALAGAEQGLSRMMLLRDVAYIAHGTELLARAHAAMDRSAEALGVIDDALALLEGTDMQPDLERMRALRQELTPSPDRPSSSPTPTEPPFVPVEPLTEREREVLSEAARGLSNREIAKALFVSTGTIKTHMHRILRKLEVDNRTRAVHRARVAGLL
jgi:LuxR family maltose regulon positive regulatory protein